MTPSPQEVAALVANLNMDAHLYARTRPEQSSRASQAAAALTAQAARIAELERANADLNNLTAMASLCHVTVLERECAELRKDAAKLDWLDGRRSEGTTMAMPRYYWRFPTEGDHWANNPHRAIRAAIDAAMTAKPTEGRK